MENVLSKVRALAETDGFQRRYCLGAPFFEIRFFGDSRLACYTLPFPNVTSTVEYTRNRHLYTKPLAHSHPHPLHMRYRKFPFYLEGGGIGNSVCVYEIQG